ncbi:hypothetical protein [Helicobacter cetorum]|uniref:Lipoprotein n=1 Tax=Helicobacter cetorum (strain ATCC BAA-429 / MIT 00-7128) TaxID=182217 RepID=I0EM16_HELC0|nr:hypothetical protein [Helicobacter cetorum]AFI03985.1 hypothetical protein HCW_03530 [Helicobacter cetorum MIT 00-7128]
MSYKSFLLSVGVSVILVGCGSLESIVNPELAMRKAAKQTILSLENSAKQLYSKQKEMNDKQSEEIIKSLSQNLTPLFKPRNEQEFKTHNDDLNTLLWYSRCEVYYGNRPISGLGYLARFNLDAYNEFMKKLFQSSNTQIMDVESELNQAPFKSLSETKKESLAKGLTLRQMGLTGDTKKRLDKEIDTKINQRMEEDKNNNQEMQTTCRAFYKTTNLILKPLLAQRILEIDKIQEYQSNKPLREKKYQEAKRFIETTPFAEPSDKKLLEYRAAFKASGSDFDDSLSKKQQEIKRAKENTN